MVNQSGLTLMELLIVVLIISTTTAIAIPQFSAYRVKMFTSYLEDHNIDSTQFDSDSDKSDLLNILYKSHREKYGDSISVEHDPSECIDDAKFDNQGDIPNNLVEAKRYTDEEILKIKKILEDLTKQKHEEDKIKQKVKTNISW